MGREPDPFATYADAIWSKSCWALSLVVVAGLLKDLGSSRGHVHKLATPYSGAHG